MLTVVKNNFIFLKMRIKYNIISELNYPLNFFLQIISMIFNNVLLIISWFFVFSKFNNINGFNYKMMLGLYSVSMISFGLTYFLFGNIAGIAELVKNNEIDALLTQPKDVLMKIISYKSDVVALGDVFVGFVLFFYVYSAIKLPLFICCLICSTIIVASFTIFFETLSFRLKYSAYANRLFYNILQNLAVYPSNIFSFGARVIVMTILPAFFVSFVPVNLLEKFNAGMFLLLIFVSLLWFVIAYAFFYLSIKKYESGSSMNLLT